ncbi:hypothetical protein GCM10029964_018460 [Kibdelosporangium lantanae]
MVTGPEAVSGLGLLTVIVAYAATMPGRKCAGAWVTCTDNADVGTDREVMAVRATSRRIIGYPPVVEEFTFSVPNPSRGNGHYPARSPLDSTVDRRWSSQARTSRAGRRR